MHADQFRLRNLARRIEQAEREGKPYSRMFEQLRSQLAQSAERLEQRTRQRPAVRYDPDLPITAHREEIMAAIAQHPVVVVCGETGSGKSTQLPKMCLEMGRGLRGLIGHTQPRRIAARSVAARLAEELGSPLGHAVGFKIRFTDTTSPQSYIKLMTDGILLAETQGDRFLDQYDTLIIDEAHERSLNIDFLLGYVQRLLPRRPDLRLIITSATIDAERFSQHFASAEGPAPVLSVSGRTYPVEVWYRPPETAEVEGEPDRQKGVLDAIDELLQHSPHGDILVFLATEREILETARALRGRLVQSRAACDVLPLYARLPVKEQNRVFEPHTRRRIVLATNVAESSLTVPGIRYVVDDGRARISRYAARSKIQRLPIEPISQASADQRKGRCGRIGPGICIRLYSEDDYLVRDRFTAPEIRRSNLASVILQAESLRLGRLSDYPFLDPPQPHLIRDGYATLFELGAVDEDDQLTPLGRQLSRLPTDPRIGRIILAGIEEGCLREILIIAAALEAQDPRDRPADKQQAADEAHARFADPESDFLSYLRLWDFYHHLKEKLSRNQLTKACRQNFLSPTRMHEWLEIYRQLKQLVAEHLPDADRGAGRRVRGKGPVSAAAQVESTDRGTELSGYEKRERDAWYGRIHRALLAGLLSNIAVRTDVNEYTGAGQVKLYLWPGSAAFAEKPKWIVAAELVETTRRYARCVAGIRSSWIEPLAGHLVQRTYSEPHWNGKNGTSMVNEKVTLFGLTVVPRRSVPYSKVDSEHARELFIRHGLVEGDLRASTPFLEHNRKLRKEVEQLTAKSRRTDLVVNEYAMYSFYNQRLPADVSDWARLIRWLRVVQREDARRLYMSLSDMTAATEAPRAEDFPDQLRFQRLELPLEYRFEPGGEDDGVTLVIPQAGLGQVSPQRLGWLVPGLLEQKVEALIRNLPKNIRRNLIPVPETARKVVRELRFGQGDLIDGVARLLSQIAGERIEPELLAHDKLPDHLRMNIRVVDERGRTLHCGRDLAEARQQLGIPQDADQPLTVPNPWQREGIVRWDFGPLPVSVDFPHGGVTLTAYPSLVDHGESVSLRLFETQSQAEAQLRAGVRRLFVLADQRELRAQVAWLPDLKQLMLYAANLMTSAEFQADVIALLADRAFLGEHPLPRSPEEFRARLAAGRDEMVGAVQDVTRLLGPLFKNYHAVRLALEEGRPDPGADADVQSQLTGLLGKHFLVTTPWSWVRRYPRYLEAIRIRLEKLTQGGLARDRQAQADLAPRLAAYVERLAEHQRRGIQDQELATYRWMIEELRVSLFAQQLGTAMPVSLKRLDKQWERVA